MKKLIIILGVAVALIYNASFAYAAPVFPRTTIPVDSNTPTQYRMELPLNVSGSLSVASSGTMSVVSLGSTGNPCVSIANAGGLFATSTCGGAGGTTTTITLSSSVFNGPAFTFATSSPINITGSGSTLTFTCATCLTTAVTSLNSITGATILAAGTGISISSSSQTITVTNTGVTSLGAATGSITLGSNLLMNGQKLVASSSFSLAIGNPTSTVAPTTTIASWNYQKTFSQISCVDLTGTTTIRVWNTTTTLTRIKNADIIAGDFVCGTGNTTTTFTSSTLPANFGLVVDVSTTVGTPTQVTVFFQTTNQ